MKIEGNQKELDAMVEFHKGNRVEGLRLQEEFAAEFRKEYKDKDHCPCLKACRYHGNCKECVAIHRAHQEHVPNCMRPLINKKLKLMSGLFKFLLIKSMAPSTSSGILVCCFGFMPVGFGCGDNCCGWYSCLELFLILSMSACVKFLGKKGLIGYIPITKSPF